MSASIDIRFVVPVEAGIDIFRNGFAFNRLHSRFHGPVTNADRILRNRASHFAAVDRIHLLLTGIVADDNDFIFLQFRYGIQNTDS